MGYELLFRPTNNVRVARGYRLVQQRTACLDAVRSAYFRDVISVKDFLQQQVRTVHSPPCQQQRL